METPVLSIQNLSKRYGSITAIDDLNLQIHKGDVFGILGLLLAIPLAAVIEIVLSELLARSTLTAASLQSATLLSVQYAESMAAVQAQMLAAEGRLSPTQLNMVERLTRLSDEAQPVLQGKG